MILSLVAEGRTVVLSSHLLDEVERTCDAVAIVDRGSIIRQGPISELLAGAPVALQVECSEPGRASALLAGTTLGTTPGARIEPVPSALGLEITLPGGHRTRRDRRSQPRSRRRRNLRLPASAGPDLARIVVPAGHKQAGGPGMTTTPASGAPAPGQAAQAAPGQAPPAGHSRDRRGSPVPTAGMITSKVMELRKRHGLMIALIAANIGFPALFMLIRLLLHAFAPRRQPARRQRPDLQDPGGRLHTHLRLHHGGHGGLHGWVARPHRRHVPAPGGDRPVPAGALPGPDPRRAGDCGADGRDRLHDRLRGKRLRRTGLHR